MKIVKWFTYTLLIATLVCSFIFHEQIKENLQEFVGLLIAFFLLKGLLHLTWIIPLWKKVAKRRRLKRSDQIEMNTKEPTLNPAQ